MRHQGRNAGLTALAIAGNHVVLIGWDMERDLLRSGPVLGFAIERTRSSDGERIWLAGMKTFQAVDPNPAPGVPVSSRRHPLQTFQWSDYTVSPGQAYRYRVVAMAGRPDALIEAASVVLDVTTERVDLGPHAVFFNRGAIASQEYARRFQNRPPDEIGQPAFDWLSRGLVEGLESFIDQAEAGDELRGAFFEFKNTRIYDRLKAARQRGAAILILYDADSQRQANEEAIAAAGIADMVAPRAHSGGFAHNKFLILVRDGSPSEVWTGSTNLSQNGIFGHSNNAHLVRDTAVAERYAAYWEVLRSDRTLRPTALAAEALGAAPPVPWTVETSAVFSPRTGLDALDWYADLAAGAERALFATFAFGMDERFVRVYDRTDQVLRFALMEKKGNGRQYKRQAEEIDRIRRRPNTVVSVGDFVQINAFDRWLVETDRVTAEVNVRFVHTKYMLIDPLGPNPVLIVGSANFSEASTDKNDENMLVIRGNPAIADIYLGEFMRLFSHYAFRESLGFHPRPDPVEALRRKYLVPDASWVEAGYFTKGSDRALRRRYFSGQPEDNG